MDLGGSRIHKHAKISTFSYYQSILDFLRRSWVRRRHHQKQNVRSSQCSADWPCSAPLPIRQPLSGVPAPIPSSKQIDSKHVTVGESFSTCSNPISRQVRIDAAQVQVAQSITLGALVTTMLTLWGSRDSIHVQPDKDTRRTYLLDQGQQRPLDGSDFNFRQYVHPHQYAGARFALSVDGLETQLTDPRLPPQEHSRQLQTIKLLDVPLTHCPLYTHRANQSFVVDVDESITKGTTTTTTCG